jgi:hypothetical protein
MDVIDGEYARRILNLTWTEILSTDPWHDETWKYKN